MYPISKVKNMLKEKNLDGLFVSTAATITYLTGFDFLSPTEREAFLLLTSSKNYVLSSQLYKEELVQKVPDFIFLEISSTKESSWWEHVRQVSNKENLKQIGFEANNLTVSEYTVLKKQNLTLSPVQLGSIRDVKDNTEIAVIENACNLTDQAFSSILGEIKPGMTEKQVGFLLDSFIRTSGAEPSFATIVAFGKNAAVPHHQTDTTTLKKQDTILLDFGVKLDSYCSDMTRTVFMGKPTKEQTRIYETVRIAQEKAIDYIFSHKLPIPAPMVDKIAREYILSQGFPEFPHSLGHSIGIEVHDGFRLSPTSKTELIEGMVFSIEPGIYLPGTMGVRIEDIVALTEKGLKLLTKSSRELIVL